MGRKIQRERIGEDERESRLEREDGEIGFDAGRKHWDKKVCAGLPRTRK